MSNQLPNVVFVVIAGKEHGIGHLKRCSIIAGSGKKSFNSYFSIVDYDDSDNISDILNFPIIDLKNLKEMSLVSNGIDAIVTDCRDTNKKFMRSLIKIAPVISIDDLGKGARHAVLRIISLPTLKKPETNYNGLQYLVLDPLIDKIKQKIKDSNNEEKRGIVVSFGGSDPHNLTLEIVKILLASNYRPKVIKGPFYRGSLEGIDVDIIENPKNIYDLIARAELLITSFGITMFEALYLGTPVILYNHTKYHYKLSLKYDLPNLAYPGYFSKSDMKRILLETINNKERLLSSCEKYQSLIDINAHERIIRIIRGTIDNGRKDCLFHHHSYRIIFRKEDYSVCKCLKCGDLFLSRMSDTRDKYRKDYFLEEYIKQYGKSYEDDKKDIIKSGNVRLDKIEELKPDRGRLLDIGCALGFFVELSLNRGWESQGIEISEYASNWARSRLGINVITGNFLSYNFKKEYFDAITMFYVLEHFSNVEDVIKKIYTILRKGGVLAIAIPNRGGISYRLNRKNF